MADSARGVSNTRSEPNSVWRPSVTRNTPPSGPMSSPNTSIRASSASDRRSASFRALTMVNSATPGPLAFLGEPQRFLALAGKVRREVGEDPFEHLAHRPGARTDHAGAHAMGEFLGLLLHLLEEPGVGRSGS